MPPSRIRFVTACQQLLALGVVLAVLTPAASVISLDVVHDRQAQLRVVPDEEASDLTVGLSAARQAQLDRGSVVRRAGDLDADGRDDLVARTPDGRLYLLPGRRDGRFGAPVRLPRSKHVKDVCCSTLKGSGPWRALRRTSR